MNYPHFQPYPSLDAPWSLHFGRDGTEDVGVIRSADDSELVMSRHFWRPEARDPMPLTLYALRVMTAAPELKDAVSELLLCLIERQTLPGVTFTLREQTALQLGLKALLKAGERS